MPALYVASTGSNTSPYDTWAKAATSPTTAINAAAAGDTVYVNQESFTIGADATWTVNGTISSPVRIIGSNDTVNEPPQTLGTWSFTQTTTSYDLQIDGVFYIYGLTFGNTGSTTGAITLRIGTTDGSYVEMENCHYSVTSSATTSLFQLGDTSAYENCGAILRNCTFKFGNASQGITVAQGLFHLIGCSVASGGTSPTNLFRVGVRGICKLVAEGCDFTNQTSGAICLVNASVLYGVIDFINCSYNSGATFTDSISNPAVIDFYAYNCSSGDTHYHLYHANTQGTTVCDTGIYANDGASYDGTNRLSWKIITNSTCNYAAPYYSPWIDCYHSGTSAITPSLEIVRSGSATAYQDDEIWGEFSYQGTSGFPLATIVSDRKALLAAAADQTTGALGAGDWTGENATSWFGKLNPTATITPAEIGHLRARVVVGEPSITVYVDPTIRGRS